MTSDDTGKSRPRKQKKDVAWTELEQRVAELTEALQRERADAENLRRRHNEQIVNLRISVKTDIVRDLLPVIDNVDRALKHVPPALQGNDFVKGVQHVARQFEKTLEQLGVQRIKTVGEPFNPHYHEAVSVESGEGSQETVIEELQAGYTLGDHVIRPAMVKVAA